MSTKVFDIGQAALVHLSDAEISAQLAVQSGAIHAMQTLIRKGVTRAVADQLLRDLVHMNRLLDQEKRRRLFKRPKPEEAESDERDDGPDPGPAAA